MKSLSKDELIDIVEFDSQSELTKGWGQQGSRISVQVQHFSVGQMGDDIIDTC